MIKESKSVCSKLENLFFCTTLVSNSLQENSSPNGKTYVIEEVYRSGAIKINNAEGTNPKVVNGQWIKYYISGTPINIESNIIQTMTPEEHIKESFCNTPESWKKEVRDTISKQTLKNPQKYFLSVLEYFRILEIKKLPGSIIHQGRQACLARPGVLCPPGYASWKFLIFLIF